jgi:hypothetical protein
LAFWLPGFLIGFSLLVPKVPLGNASRKVLLPLIAPENEAGALGTHKEEIARRGAERAEKKGRKSGGVHR